MKIFLIVASLFFLSSCLRKVEGESDFSVYSGDIQLLKNLESKCAEINAEGNINDLRKSMHKKARSILVLSEHDIASHVEEIRSIGNSINEDILKIKHILSSDYTKASYVQKIDWKINKKMIQDALEAEVQHRHSETTTWKMKSFEIIKTYKNGIEISPSIKTFFISPESDHFEIFYKDEASTLDICQLQETFLFVFEVRYQRKEGYVKNGEDLNEVIRLRFGLHAENPTSFSLKNRVEII
jgi:hypothetical protein